MWLAVFYVLGVCYTGIVMRDVMPFIPVNVPREHRLWLLLATTRMAMAVAFVVFWPVLWFASAVRLVWRAVAFVAELFTKDEEEQ